MCMTRYFKYLYFRTLIYVGSWIFQTHWFTLLKARVEHGKGSLGLIHGGTLIHSPNVSVEHGSFCSFQHYGVADWWGAELGWSGEEDDTMYPLQMEWKRNHMTMEKKGEGINGTMLCWTDHSALICLFSQKYKMNLRPFLFNVILCTRCHCLVENLWSWRPILFRVQ